jgi:hypothetical protein
MQQNAALDFAIVTKRVVSYFEWDGYKRRGGREAEGGGLLIHPDLFARADFRLFCLRYELLSCTESPHLQSIVQQLFSKVQFSKMAGQHR